MTIQQLLDSGNIILLIIVHSTMAFWSAQRVPRRWLILLSPAYESVKKTATRQQLGDNSWYIALCIKHQPSRLQDRSLLLAQQPNNRPGHLLMFQDATVCCTRVKRALRLFKHKQVAQSPIVVPWVRIAFFLRASLRMARWTGSILSSHSACHQLELDTGVKLKLKNHLGLAQARLAGSRGSI